MPVDQLIAVEVLALHLFQEFSGVQGHSFSPFPGIPPAPRILRGKRVRPVSPGIPNPAPT